MAVFSYCYHRGALQLCSLSPNLCLNCCLVTDTVNIQVQGLRLWWGGVGGAGGGGVKGQREENHSCFLTHMSVVLTGGVCVCACVEVGG